MYEQLFQLRSRPFRCFPVPDDYYPARSVHQALGQIKLCLDRQSGSAVIIGEAGLGKTLALTMVAEYHRQRFQCAVIQCSQLTDRSELLQTILFELGQPYRNQSEGEMRLALTDYIRNGCRQQNGVLLLVDDAQSIAVELLAELGATANLVWQGSPRAHLILAGNHKLDELLANADLESLNQRIAARCYLSPFSSAETADYVRTHLKRAGAGTREFFSPDALGRIHQLCQGIPRLINMLCDHALILLATLGGSRVDASLIETAWSDVQRLPGAADLFQQEETAESDEPWSVIEFGELDDSPTETNNKTNPGEAEKAPSWSISAEQGGYSWKPLAEGELTDEMVQDELNRLQSEQEDLIRQVESAAAELHGEGPRNGNSPPAPQRIVDPFADDDFDFEEQVVSPAVRFSWKHNQGASQLAPADLAADFPWPNCEFDLSDSVVIIEETRDAAGPAKCAPCDQPDHDGPCPNEDPDAASVSVPLEKRLSHDGEESPSDASKTGRHSDDSDLLVVSRVHQFPSKEKDCDDEASSRSGPPSTGRAVRMDYESLFDRLRGNNDSQSTT